MSQFVEKEGTTCLTGGTWRATTVMQTFEARTAFILIVQGSKY